MLPCAKAVRQKLPPGSAPAVANGLLLLGLQRAGRKEAAQPGLFIVPADQLYHRQIPPIGRALQRRHVLCKLRRPGHAAWGSSIKPNPLHITRRLRTPGRSACNPSTQEEHDHPPGDPAKKSTFLQNCHCFSPLLFNYTPKYPSCPAHRLPVFQKSGSIAKTGGILQDAAKYLRARFATDPQGKTHRRISWPAKYRFMGMYSTAAMARASRVLGSM